jgi:hypothetical protein
MTAHTAAFIFAAASFAFLLLASLADVSHLIICLRKDRDEARKRAEKIRRDQIGA